jgi:hypothetical protein
MLLPLGHLLAVSELWLLPDAVVLTLVLLPSDLVLLLMCLPIEWTAAGGDLEQAVSK